MDIPEINVVEMSKEEIAKTGLGKQFDELDRLRKDFEEYCADQAAYNATQEKRHKLTERRQFWRGALAGAIGSSVANILIYYWPNIISAFSFLLHV